MPLATAALPLWMHLSLMDECRFRVEQAVIASGAEPDRDMARRMKLYALDHVQELPEPFGYSPTKFLDTEKVAGLLVALLQSSLKSPAATECLEATHRRGKNLAVLISSYWHSRDPSSPRPWGRLLGATGTWAHWAADNPDFERRGVAGVFSSLCGRTNGPERAVWSRLGIIGRLTAIGAFETSRLTNENAS